MRKAGLVSLFPSPALAAARLVRCTVRTYDVSVCWVTCVLPGTSSLCVVSPSGWVCKSNERDRQRHC